MHIFQMGKGGSLHLSNYKRTTYKRRRKENNIQLMCNWDTQIILSDTDDDHANGSNENHSAAVEIANSQQGIHSQQMSANDANHLKDSNDDHPVAEEYVNNQEEIKSQRNISELVTDGTQTEDQFYKNCQIIQQWVEAEDEPDFIHIMADMHSQDQI